MGEARVGLDPSQHGYNTVSRAEFGEHSERLELAPNTISRPEVGDPDAMRMRTRVMGFGLGCYVK